MYINQENELEFDVKINTERNKMADCKQICQSLVRVFIGVKLEYKGIYICTDIKTMFLGS